MKTIHFKKIHEVLTEAYQKGTEQKPYSVLFVADDGFGIKEQIESWLKQKGETYITLKNGNMIFYDQDKLPKEYTFSPAIEDNKIVFLPYDTGYGKDVEWKNQEHQAYMNLIHKNGVTVDRDLRLVITHVYYPEWNAGTPMYDEKDYPLFDEVYHVQKPTPKDCAERIHEKLFYGKNL